MEVNIGGTINVCEAMKENEKKPILIYTSSRSIYGEPQYLPVDEKHPPNPNGQYNVAKLTGEYYLRCYMQNYDIRPVIFRLSTTFGERQWGYEEQGVVAYMVFCASQGKTFTFFGDGLQLRDPTYVKDVIEAMMLAVEKPEVSVGQTFNIGAGWMNAITLRGLARSVSEVVGNRLKTSYGAPRMADVRRYVTDYSKAEKLLGWKPKTHLVDGLVNLWSWAGNLPLEELPNL
jgi:nucleoside-diphosphate-sugar epimerase